MKSGNPFKLKVVLIAICLIALVSVQNALSNTPGFSTIFLQPEMVPPTGVDPGNIAASLYEPAEIVTTCETVGCNANDLQVDSVFLADDAGNRIEDITCTPGQTVPGLNLRIKFKGNTNSERYALLAYFDVDTNDVFFEHIQICYDPPGGIMVGSYHNVTPFAWTCGTKVTLKNFYMSWQENSGQTCACGTSKCNFNALPIIVYGPLYANFKYSSECVSGKPYKTITYTDMTSGGRPPYSYNWNFGTGATPATATTAGPHVVNYSSGGTKSVTLTVTDTKRTSSISKFVSVGNCCDLQFTVTAKDTIVECNGSGNLADLDKWLKNHGGARASDVSGNLTTWDYTPNPVVLSDLCGATGAATVVFKISDICGNSLTTSAKFTIRDITPPTITKSASNMTVDCNGAGNTADLQAWLTGHGGAEATDACGGVTWSYNTPNLSDLCGATGAAIVTFTATDVCGNPATTSATFTVRDITPPTITKSAANKTVDCNGTGNTADLQAWLTGHGGAEATDVCGGVTWSYNTPNLSDLCGATGAAIVTFTATDVCGNPATTSATFTIRDITPPTITKSAANKTVDCDGTGNAADLQAWLTGHGGAEATDVCGGVTWTYNTPSLSNLCGGTGAVAVTFTATDDCGNPSTTTATFTIRDITPPTITKSASNKTVDCNGAGNTADLQAWLSGHGDAEATDACGGVTWSYSTPNLSDLCGATGAVIVTFTATDDCGNPSTTSATFTIRDITPPNITKSASNKTVDCNGAGNTADLQAWLTSHGGAEATDVCGGVTWSYSTPNLSDLCGATGAAIVTFTATDACGNPSTTSATFTIRDITPPTITTAASDKTVECNGSGNKTELQAWLDDHGGARASDLCGGVTWSYSTPNLSDLCGATGAAIVTFTATDACGNPSTTSATFTIQDKTSPSITAQPSNKTVECDGSGNTAQLASWLASFGGAAATDVCSSGVKWSHDFTALSDGCGATGSATVVFTVTDECGNIASAKAAFIINDTTPPAIKCANDLTIECPSVPVFSAPVVSDQCDPNPTITFRDEILPGKCSQAYTAVRTWTVTDACGNPSVCSQKVSVVDKTPPVLKTEPICVYLSKYGSWALDPLNIRMLTEKTTDNCSPYDEITYTINPRSFDCIDINKEMLVTVVATDACGNSVTETEYVTVKDTLKPIALCQNITTYLDKFGQAFVADAEVNLNNDEESYPEWAKFFSTLGNGSYDNCKVSNLRLSRQIFTCKDVGHPVEVILTAFDPSGNSGTCKAMVTVLDTMPMIVKPVEDIVMTVTPGTCSTKIAYPEIKVTDNCSVTLEKTAGLGTDGNFPLGTTTETWKLTEAGGTSTSVSFHVTIHTYNAAPTINPVADVTVEKDAAKSEILLSGIGVGPECVEQQILSLDVVNSDPTLLTVTKDYLNGSPTGKLVVVPQANKTGVATITLTLKDNGGTANGGTDTTVKTFTVTVKVINHVPQVTPVPDQVIVLPNTLSVNVVNAFKDADEGDVLTFTVTKADGSALPSWMTFDASAGILKGTPATADIGVTEVKVTATDKAGASASDVFLVIVSGQNASALHITAVSGTNLLTGGYIVALFLKEGDFFKPVQDNIPVFQGGTYSYYNLQPGTYFAKAIIIDPVMNPGLMNTYYESAVSVNSALQIVFTTPETKTIQIKMQTLPVQAGTYKISGIVVRKTGTPDMIDQGQNPVSTPAPGVDMVLKQNGIVVANTITGTDGRYAFTGLPAGTYEVFVEVPGYTQIVTQKVILDEANPLKDKVDFTIWTGTGTYVITKVNILENHFGVSIYPNPTTGKVNVELIRTTMGKVDITVNNILGVQVFHSTYPAENFITVDLSDQATGIYLIKLNTNGRSVVKKLTLYKK